MHSRKRHFQNTRLNHQLGISIMDKQLQHGAHLVHLRPGLGFVDAIGVIVIEKEKIEIDQAKTRRQIISDPNAQGRS